jgi:hypothetical protein
MSSRDDELITMEATELDLYGVAELARRWGISKQGAAKLAKQMTEPKRLSCGPIWTGDQVAAYEKKHPRRNVQA